jgi:ActR/RegA family two-component response regulator
MRVTRSAHIVLTMTDAAETIAVVLVEDDDRLARLTARYLESHGVVVTIASDGREGIAKVMQNRPDVEAHKGTISFTSELGKGTIARVRLPAAD